MSDQDFFFDEDEQVAEEAPKKRASTAKSADKADVAAPKAEKAAPVARKSTTATATAAGAGIFEQNVSMTVAALMTVIGVLVGVIIGFVVAPDGATVSTNTGTTTGTDAEPAPQLSEDQLNSGALPDGHPDIGAVATDTATPAAP